MRVVLEITKLPAMANVLQIDIEVDGTECGTIWVDEDDTKFPLLETIKFKTEKIHDKTTS